MQQDPLSILKTYWGYDSFRPLQSDIIHAVLQGKDVLALLPTGAGKSVCFQVPALAMDGLCLVVSPLIALMKDQVEQLKRRGITAFSIFSGMTRKEVMQTLKVAGESNCKFLYVSPERLETRLFLEYLPSLNVQLLAIDEAHCISQWGYDFRPPYLRIAKIREELPHVPVLALTASATPDVQEDICEKLQFTERNIFRSSFVRPNLSFSVFQTDSVYSRITDILQKMQGSSIVYCRSRKRTVDIARLLHLHGISADYYHAGLDSAERSRKQEAWIKDKVRTIVCTNAFGMGIDKPNVRLVIHADLPECLENYYQEAGRAGRDGNKSYAVLLYDENRISELEELPDKRYPALEEVRAVYQSLVNYLQIPAGLGAETYFDFNIGEFIKRFGHDSALVTAALSTLEQENYLSFNQQVWLPARVRFTTGKKSLYDFETNHPQLEPLIKILLRTYEGIFDYGVSVYEKLIARKLHISEEVCKEQLDQLHRYRIIDYIPMKDQPQVYFFNNRVEAARLTINESYYAERKRQFTHRIAAMIAYIRNTSECRSRKLANYFGDPSSDACGICDNCLEARRVKLKSETFEQISKQMLEELRMQTLTGDELISRIKTFSSALCWEVIDYLQSENRIIADENGKLKVSEK
jgi:ATP-dependent DNA helicase RecQ